MSVRYAPGDTFALVRPGVVLLVDAAVSAFTIATLWDALVAAEPGAPTATVLDVVTSVLDPTLRALPDFALVVHQAETDASGRSQDVVHVAARGQMVVTLRTSIGSRTVAAPEMTTWADQRVFGVLEYEAGAHDGETAAAVPQVLTVTEGVVKVSALQWQEQPIRPQSAAVAAAVPVAGGGLIDEAALKDLVAGLESIPAGEPQQYTLTDSGAQSIVLSSGLTLVEEVESDFARTLGGIPDEWTRSAPVSEETSDDREDRAGSAADSGDRWGDVDDDPAVPDDPAAAIPANPVELAAPAPADAPENREVDEAGGPRETQVPVGSTFEGVGPYTLPADEVDDMTVFSLDMIRTLASQTAALPSQPGPDGDDGTAPSSSEALGSPVVHQTSPSAAPRQQEPDLPLAPAAQVGADRGAPAAQPGDRMGDYVRGYGQSVPGRQHALDRAGGVSVLAGVDPFAAAQPRPPVTSPTRVIAAPPAPTAAQQFAAYQSLQVEDRGEELRPAAAEPTLEPAAEPTLEPAAAVPTALPPVPLPDLETHDHLAPVDYTIAYAQLAAFRHPTSPPAAPTSECKVVYREPTTAEPAVVLPEQTAVHGALAGDSVRDETTEEPIPDPAPEADLVPQAQEPLPHLTTPLAAEPMLVAPMLTTPTLTEPPAPPAPEASGPTRSVVPQVLARRCFFGHVNPSARTTCQHCGGGLSPNVQLADRPVLGRVRFSSGEVVDIDQPIVVGRFPQRLDGQHAAEEPVRLMSVFSPNQDISRSHLEVRLDGWNVLVVDLGTMNGSTLHRAGYPPYHLPPQSPTLVVDGDLVDMGDGVGVTFEGLG